MDDERPKIKLKPGAAQRDPRRKPVRAATAPHRKAEPHDDRPPKPSRRKAPSGDPTPGDALADRPPRRAADRMPPGDRPARPDRPARAAPGDDRPDRAERAPRREGRGPGRDERVPGRVDRGPARDDRGAFRDDRGPLRDDRGPRREVGGPPGEHRPPRRDDRGVRRDGPAAGWPDRPPRAGRAGPGPARSDARPTEGRRPPRAGGPGGFGAPEARGPAGPGRPRTGPTAGGSEGPSPRPPRPAPTSSPRPASSPSSSAPRPRPDEATNADSGIRLSKRLADEGVASRREADEWIEAGWVRVDGKLAVLGQRVLPHQQVDIDPAARHQQARRVTVLLHKPLGYVSGQAEDGHEPASVLVTEAHHWAEDPARIPWQPGHGRGLAPAGRLDIDSTGLLVLTQDGRIARELIGDDSDIEKEYLVRVVPAAGEGAPMPDVLGPLEHGLELDGVKLKRAKVSWANEDQLRFVLREGRKRQIRRMCEAVGLKVVALKRVRIGRIPLGKLPPGQWRYLGEFERF